jgi:shikimate kinase
VFRTYTARVSRTVWLVGMMGAGKSTLGPRLASALGHRFVDADAALESEAGASVAELFRREGEAGFRARERALIEKLAGDRGCVVALGGGAMAQPGIAEFLRLHGTVVYLRARPETLLERIGDGETRPLLAGLKEPQRSARLKELLAERDPVYRLAQVTVDTDDAAPDEVVSDLCHRLRTRLL